MFKVAVIDSKKNVLEPCHPAVARRLLRERHAAVWCKHPFTIILKRSIDTEEIVTSEYQLNWDPGSKTSGFAVLDAENSIVLKAELHHRGGKIKTYLAKRAGFRRGRRTRNLRHRPARWANRSRKVPVLTPDGWVYKSADETDPSKDSSKTQNKFVRVSHAQLKDPRYQWSRIQKRKRKKFTPEMTNAKVARLTRDELIQQIKMRDKKATSETLTSKTLGDLRRLLKSKLRNTPPVKQRWERKRIAHKKRSENGWIAPSLMSRVFNIETWTRRILKLYPIKRLAIEHVKFATQLLENPDIHGIEYQQGTLWGREIREYLLELTNRKCAYCGKGGQRLEVEHIIPRSHKGSSRIDNLTMACHACNEKKGALVGDALEKQYPDIAKKVKSALQKSKRGLSDAAAVNTIRWKLTETLNATELPVFLGTGGRTAHNRIDNAVHLPKTHYYDAASVENPVVDPCSQAPVLVVQAIGYGRRDNLKYNFGVKAGGKFPEFRQPNSKVSHAGGFHKGDHVFMMKKGRQIEGVINCFNQTDPGKPRECRVSNFYSKKKDNRVSGNISQLRRFRHRDGYLSAYRQDRPQRTVTAQQQSPELKQTLKPTKEKKSEPSQLLLFA